MGAEISTLKHLDLTFLRSKIAELDMLGESSLNTWFPAPPDSLQIPAQVLILYTYDEFLNVVNSITF
ncbi:MAG: hypothetical protein QW699_02060 [Metallosphaera sp.]